MNEATHEFIGNIRNFGGMLFPQAEAAEPKISPSQITAIQQGIAISAVWLHDSALSGYDTADFSDISPAAESTIRSCVERLKALLAGLSRNQAPSKAVFDEAFAVYQKLFEAISVNYPSDIV